MSTYQRPLRPDELMHWGKGETSKNHKYIAKIGNRYFYTPQDLQAFKQGVSGKVSSAKETVSDTAKKIGSAGHKIVNKKNIQAAEEARKRADKMKAYETTTKKASKDAATRSNNALNKYAEATKKYEDADTRRVESETGYDAMINETSGRVYYRPDASGHSTKQSKVVRKAGPTNTAEMEGRYAEVEKAWDDEYRAALDYDHSVSKANDAIARAQRTRRNADNASKASKIAQKRAYEAQKKADATLVDRGKEKLNAILNKKKKHK